MNEQERTAELYAHLCNWYWFETNPDEPLTEVMHTSDKSRLFANMAMKELHRLVEYFIENLIDTPNTEEEE